LGVVVVPWSGSLFGWAMGEEVLEAEVLGSLPEWVFILERE
jgi:hypothetical protein